MRTHVTVALLGALPFTSTLAGCGEEAPTEPPTAQQEAPLGSPLAQNRDRLLSGMGASQGKSACQVWSDMTPQQKGVFLTITDLLHNRSFLVNEGSLTLRSTGDACSPIGWDCSGGCQVEDELTGYCQWQSPEQCKDAGECYTQPVARTNFDTALNHVTKIYAVRGNDCSPGSPGCTCGGGDSHRVYFSADDTLIGVIRNFDFGLPEWDDSNDIGGPHAPFNNSSETLTGQPRGQMHFWRWDWEAQSMTRPGVWGVYDPHLVEIDIDYNWIHDSNPECSYSGQYGRNAYASLWQSHGNGASAELDYAPSNCGSGAQVFGDVPPSNPYFDDINLMKQKGVTNGCQANPPMFCPDQTLPRWQAAVFLMRGKNLGMPDYGLGFYGGQADNFSASTTQTFLDVPPGHPGFKHVQKMADLGYTKGCSVDQWGNKYFCPDDPVTHGQLAVFVTRARYGDNFAYSPNPKFGDVGYGHPFFKYVQRASDDGVGCGCASGWFCADSAAEREHAAAFIARAFLGAAACTGPTP